MKDAVSTNYANELESFEAVRRQQSFGWCQLKETSWKMSRGWFEVVSGWEPINFTRC